MDGSSSIVDLKEVVTPTEACGRMLPDGDASARGTAQTTAANARL
jgi:hypothetical protein